MSFYCCSIWALCLVVSGAFVSSLGTVHAGADDLGDEPLYREVARTVQKREWGRASAALDRWLVWRKEHYGAQSKETGAAYQYGGQIYVMAGQHAKAIEAFQQALAIFRVDPGPRSRVVGLLLAAIAEAQQAQGQGSEAIASYREALDIFEVDPGPEAAATATCLNKLSLLLLYRDAFHEAEPLMRRALSSP